MREKEIHLVFNHKAGSGEKDIRRELNDLPSNLLAGIKKDSDIDELKNMKGLEDFLTFPDGVEPFILAGGGDGTNLSVAAEVLASISRGDLNSETLFVPLAYGNQNAVPKRLGLEGLSLSEVLQLINDCKLRTLNALPHRIKGDNFSERAFFWTAGGYLAEIVLAKVEERRKSGRLTHGYNPVAALSGIWKLVKADPTVILQMNGEELRASDITYVTKDFPFYTSHFRLQDFSDKSSGDLLFVINDKKKRQGAELLAGMTIDALWAEIVRKNQFPTPTGTVSVQAVQGDKVTFDYGYNPQIQVDSEIYSRINHDEPVTIFRRGNETGLNFGMR